LDAANGMIVVQTLAGQDADDPSQVGPLLNRIDDPIIKVTADGAYDGAPTYQTIAAHGDEIKVVIPPRSSAVPSGELGPPTQRDRSDDDCRARPPGLAVHRLRSTVLNRNNNGSIQRLIGQRLRVPGAWLPSRLRLPPGMAVLNRMLATGRPDSIRRQPVVAHRSSHNTLGSGSVSSFVCRVHQRPFLVDKEFP
jgi:hypothetical protein